MPASDTIPADGLPAYNRSCSETNRTRWKRLATLLVASSAAALASCGGTNDSYVRMLNVSQGYDSLDLYVDDTKALSAVASSSISAYYGLSPSSHTISFTSAGVAKTNALSSMSESFSQQKHHTYVTYGDAGHFAEMEISEDEDAASSGYTKLQILNTATDAGTVDVYLTGSDVALVDTSPRFSSVATGSKTGFSSVTSGTYRLRITASGSTTDVRLDIPSITLTSGQVVSLIVSGSAGGVLVNGALLPQQGSLTEETNPYARVRAVIGTSSGTSLTAAIGGVTLLSAAPTATIGAYQLVGVGSQAVNLTVDGTAVTVANQTLSAGADYTLLIWTSSTGTQATLIKDNNKLPTSGDANIRLINAMSGLTDPISLAVNFTPTASNLALGSGSSYSSVAASTSTQLDVTDATTATPLYSKGSVTLSAQAVYTMFMFGSSASPTGTLRGDR